MRRDFLAEVLAAVAAGDEALAERIREESRKLGEAEVAAARAERARRVAESGLSEAEYAARVHKAASEFAKRGHRRRKARRKYGDYAGYLASAEWFGLRSRALERFGCRCAVCNGQDGGVDVHHRTYERIFEEDVGDLTVLCRACHELFHERMARPKGLAGGRSR